MILDSILDVFSDVVSNFNNQISEVSDNIIRSSKEAELKNKKNDVPHHAFCM